MDDDRVVLLESQSRVSGQSWVPVNRAQCALTEAFMTATQASSCPTALSSAAPALPMPSRRKTVKTTQSLKQAFNALAFIYPSFARLRQDPIGKEDPLDRLTFTLFGNVH